jgi:hypothetical protein
MDGIRVVSGFECDCDCRTSMTSTCRQVRGHLSQFNFLEIALYFCSIRFLSKNITSPSAAFDIFRNHRIQADLGLIQTRGQIARTVLFRFCIQQGGTRTDPTAHIYAPASFSNIFPPFPPRACLICAPRPPLHRCRRDTGSAPFHRAPNLTSDDASHQCLAGNPFLRFAFPLLRFASLLG